MNIIEDFVKPRVSAMLKNPSGFGWAEAVEMQFYLLLELHAEIKEDMLFKQRYTDYLDKKLGKSNTFLTGRLSLMSKKPTQEFVLLLKEFAEIELGTKL